MQKRVQLTGIKDVRFHTDLPTCVHSLVVSRFRLESDILDFLRYHAHTLIMIAVKHWTLSLLSYDIFAHLMQGYDLWLYRLHCEANV